MTKQVSWRAARFSHKSILLASVAAITSLHPQLALAQQASGPDEKDASTIVVTGYRESLAKAREIKKQAVIQKDVIVAEDMAKFPDLNLAESLQRLPGVQISREAGEGRRISLRGLGPDFSRVQLNGMEVLGNVDSAQDSRGQRTRDRAFDFNIFASELFSRVEVEKTFQAAQNEGGMAGTVGLFTGKPFDYAPGTKGALNGKLGTNQYTKDAQPRVAALLSHNWDNRFGVLVSVAYSRRKTTEQGHNTYNYDRPDADTLQGLVDRGLDISRLSAAQQAKFLSGDLYFPDGNRISSFDSRQERLGITASMQWQPSDSLLLTLDGLYGQFTTHRDERELSTRPIKSDGSVSFDTPAGAPWPAIFQSASRINDLRWDGSDYANYTDVTGTTFGSENRRSLNKNRFRSIELTGKWDASDALTFDGHAGYQKSTYKTPYDDKFYMRGKGNLIADYGADGRSASFQYPGSDLTNPANWAMDNFYYRAFNNQSELKEGVLNSQYKLNDVFTLRAGGAYHRFSQKGMDLFYDGNVNGTTAVTRGTSVGDITDVFSNKFASFLVGNYSRGFAKYNEYHRLQATPEGRGGALQDIENVYQTSERTFDEYLQLDWNGELFGSTFRGNVGARGYQTKTKSTGWIQGDSYAYLGTTEVEGHYSGVLPALNAVLEVTPQLLLRFAATQNLNRPSLGSIAAKGTALQNEDSGEISVSRGNPQLKPFKDTTLDFAVEYYFGKLSLVSASVFQKWIKNFIADENLTDVPFSQTGVPFGTIPGATADTIVKDFSRPVNIPGTKRLTGFEVAAQVQFSFLPAPFDDLGAVTNLTYVDADKTLTGFSKLSYNATLYYENKLWGVRGSLSHRSRYYTGRNADPMDAGTRGFEGTTYVDASAFVNVTKELQVTLNANNLTNEKDTQFWGQNRYLYNQTQFGANYSVGFALKF